MRANSSSISSSFRARALACAALAFVLVRSDSARADPAEAAPPTASPYQFRWTLDVPLLTLGLAGTSAFFVENRLDPCVTSAAACSPPDDLNAIDRRVLGMYSRPALTASNLAIAALFVVPHAANLVSRGASDMAWLEDAVITAESVLVAQALTQTMKAATDRYAPLVYDASVPVDVRTGPDATRSFWSGHTATAFSAATSFAVSYALRHPRSPWRWVVLAALESTALAAGLLKIRAGYHWPSDIVAGALAGIGSGVLVPALHLRF